MGVAGKTYVTVLPVADAFSVMLEVTNEVFNVSLALAALVQVPLPLLRLTVPMVTLPLLVRVPVARYSMAELSPVITPDAPTTVLDEYKRMNVLPLDRPEPFKVPLMVSTEFETVRSLGSSPILN